MRRLDLSNRFTNLQIVSFGSDNARRDRVLIRWNTVGRQFHGRSGRYILTYKSPTVVLTQQPSWIWETTHSGDITCPSRVWIQRISLNIFQNAIPTSCRRQQTTPTAIHMECGSNYICYYSTVFSPHNKSIGGFHVSILVHHFRLRRLRCFEFVLFPSLTGSFPLTTLGQQLLPHRVCGMRRQSKWKEVETTRATTSTLQIATSGGI